MGTAGSDVGATFFDGRHDAIDFRVYGVVLCVQFAQDAVQSFSRIRQAIGGSGQLIKRFVLFHEFSF